MSKTSTPNEYGWWADRFAEGYEGTLAELVDEWGECIGEDPKKREMAERCKQFLRLAIQELEDFENQQ